MCKLLVGLNLGNASYVGVVNLTAVFLFSRGIRQA